MQWKRRPVVPEAVPPAVAATNSLYKRNEKPA